MSATLRRVVLLVALFLGVACIGRAPAATCAERDRDLVEGADVVNAVSLDGASYTGAILASYGPRQPAIVRPPAHDALRIARRMRVDAAAPARHATPVRCSGECSRE